MAQATRGRKHVRDSRQVRKMEVRSQQPRLKQDTSSTDSSTTGTRDNKPKNFDGIIPAKESFKSAEQQDLATSRL